jgi:predicted nuclease of restriction endonuclease-like (RecB) superfamily
MLFQRTALSKNTNAVISVEIANLRDGRMTPDTVFRDPYFLNFLGLQSAYSARDLESAILREIEGVLLELGSGFAFVARQKRISVGKDDFHLDLLFYHRHPQGSHHNAAHILTLLKHEAHTLSASQRYLRVKYGKFMNAIPLA